VNPSQLLNEARRLLETQAAQRSCRNPEKLLRLARSLEMIALLLDEHEQRKVA